MVSTRLRRSIRWLAVALLTAAFGGCACKDDGYCGGAFKSTADMERIHRVSSGQGASSNTTRY